MTLLSQLINHYSTQLKNSDSLEFYLDIAAEGLDLHLNDFIEGQRMLFSLNPSYFYQLNLEIIDAYDFHKILHNTSQKDLRSIYTSAANSAYLPKAAKDSLKKILKKIH